MKVICEYAKSDKCEFTVGCPHAEPHGRRPRCTSICTKKGSVKCVPVDMINISLPEELFEI